MKKYIPSPTCISEIFEVSDIFKKKFSTNYFSKLNSQVWDYNVKGSLLWIFETVIFKVTAQTT